MSPLSRSTFTAIGSGCTLAIRDASTRCYSVAHSFGGGSRRAARGRARARVAVRGACRRRTSPACRCTRSLAQTDRDAIRWPAVLILFGHTGAYSVAAAISEAAQTVTVEAADDSVTWIDNTAINQVDPRSHRVVEADPVQFASDSAKESFDLIVVRPPSALGPATARRWDVLHDHGALLQSTLPLLAADGQMYFVTTARRLKLAEGQLPDATLRKMRGEDGIPRIIATGALTVAGRYADSKTKKTAFLVCHCG